GVRKLTLVDHDTVSESNINRQLEALHSTIGAHKASALAARLLDINPEIILNVRNERYTPDTRDAFFGTEYTYIIDAIDIVTCKLDLIETAHKRGIPIISAMGTGNKTDASKLTVCDISKTWNCPLAKVMRKELRHRGILHHRVVFSPEDKLCAEQIETPPEGRRSIPGSVVWVPACAGLMMAGDVVMKIATP
ncbi:MAG: tRNA threonylcarbamoyladenosine dehydratase, partial [Clostridia bacterium]